MTSPIPSAIFSFFNQVFKFNVDSVGLSPFAMSMEVASLIVPWCQTIVNILYLLG